MGTASPELGKLTHEHCVSFYVLIAYLCVKFVYGDSSQVNR